VGEWGGCGRAEDRENVNCYLPLVVGADSVVSAI
jgi:hypothetical protein